METALRYLKKKQKIFASISVSAVKRMIQLYKHDGKQREKEKNHLLKLLKKENLRKEKIDMKEKVSKKLDLNIVLFFHICS